MTDNYDVANEKEIATGTLESQLASKQDRRKLFRRIAVLAGLGVTGALFSAQLPAVRAQIGDGADFILGEINGCVSATSLHSGPAGQACMSFTNSDQSTSYDVGVYGESDGPNGNGVKGYSNNTTTSTGGQGVLGIVEAPVTLPSTTLAGVMGLAKTGNGVYGLSSSSAGVYGISTSGNGVIGASSSNVGVSGNSSSSYGVSGSSTNGNGVLGSSTNGIGGQFVGAQAAIYANGNVGIGTANPAAPLDVVGTDASPQTGGIRLSTPTYPQLLLNVSGAGSDEKIWRLIGRNQNPTSAFQIETLDDNYANEVAAMQIIRNGTSISNVVFPNGNVGIGTTAPARSLHMQADNACFRMDRDVDSSAFILVRTAPSGNFSTVWKTFYVGVNAAGVNSGEFFIGDVGANVSGASTIRLMIDNSGNVGIGSIANTQTIFSNILTLPNTASPAGRGLANAWSTYSSIRWKMNIQPIQDALSLIQRLRGVRFNWKTGGKEDIGLIAEEVGQVVPEIVTYEPNGHDAQSLDYSRLIPVTIQAIKELNEKNDRLETENSMLRETLQAENKALRERIENQQQRIEALERKLAAS